VNELQPLTELWPHAAFERGRLRREAGADQSRSSRPCTPTPPGERGVRRALVEARTESPGDDFINALVHARAADGDGHARSPEETVSIMLQRLFAGHETKTKLMGNSFRCLLEDRASWGAICRDPGLIPNAIEEVLRFDGSVIAWRHKTKEPVEVGEARLPKDTKAAPLAGVSQPRSRRLPRPGSLRYLPAECARAPFVRRRRARLPGRAVGAAGGAHRAGGGQPPTAVTATDRERELKFPASISMPGPASLPIAW
jgi:hypothetical protein